MFGDPDNFETFVEQSKIVDISNLGTITNIAYKFINENTTGEVEVQNVKLTYGNDIKEFKQGENLIIYTNNSMLYKTQQEVTIDLLWMRRDGDELIRVPSTYGYVVPKTLTDADGLEYLSPIINWYNQNEKSDEDNYAIGSGWDLVGAETFSISKILDTNKQTETFQVVLVTNDGNYFSNKLVFKSLLYSADIATTITDTLDKLSLRFDDNTDGIYNYYGNNDMILAAAYSNALRSLTVCWNGTPLSELSGETPIEILGWDYSKSGSMIKVIGTSGDKFNYQIHENRQKNCINNTVTCRVSHVDTGAEYTVKAEMQFGRAGQAAQNKVLEVNYYEPGQTSINLTQTKVAATMLDENNDEVDIKSIRWYKDGKFYGTNNPLDLSGIVTGCVLTVVADGLTAYFPVAYSTFGVGVSFEGADTVLYDAFGNPTYQTSPYTLKNSVSSLGGINWSMKSNTASLNKSNSLVPEDFYNKGNTDNTTVTATSSTGDYWSQGVVIAEHPLNSSIINKWDGHLTIDKENDIILSKVMAAGTKDSAGKFTGVIIGDRQTLEDNGKSTILNGVYGFQKGVSTYGLLENGTAYFGKDGTTGRIEIDGEHGVIEGSNMSINLSSGLISTQNFTLDAKDEANYSMTITNQLPDGFENYTSEQKSESGPIWIINKDEDVVFGVDWLGIPHYKGSASTIEENGVVGGWTVIKETPEGTEDSIYYLSRGTQKLSDNSILKDLTINNKSPNVVTDSLPDSFNIGDLNNYSFGDLGFTLNTSGLVSATRFNGLADRALIAGFANSAAGATGKLLTYLAELERRVVRLELALRTYHSGADVNVPNASRQSVDNIKKYIPANGWAGTEAIDTIPVVIKSNS